MGQTVESNTAEIARLKRRIDELQTENQLEHSRESLKEARQWLNELHRLRVLYPTKFQKGGLMAPIFTRAENGVHQMELHLTTLQDRLMTFRSLDG